MPGSIRLIGGGSQSKQKKQNCSAACLVIELCHYNIPNIVSKTNLCHEPLYSLLFFLSLYVHKGLSIYSRQDSGKNGFTPSVQRITHSFNLLALFCS